MRTRQTRRILIVILSLCVLLFSYLRNWIPDRYLQFFSSDLHPTQSLRSEVKGVATFSKVTRVVDGDTLVALVDGKNQKVRLIGINTPETVDPRRPVECFGKEAKQYLSSLLMGKNIRMESDPTQDDKDKYGRLLRYIFLEDGTFINKKIILEGYAFEYTYNIPYKYQEEFKTAEKEARETSRGLWNSNTCNGVKEIQ